MNIFNDNSTRNIVIFILSMSLFSCQQDITSIDLEEEIHNVLSDYKSLPKYPEAVIEIKSKNFVPDLALQILQQLNVNNKSLATRSAYEVVSEETWGNGFSRTVNARSSECVLMENLHRYTYIGSVLQAASVANYDYKSIPTKTTPINVSVSFPAKRVTGTIVNPSLSKTRQFVMNLMQQIDIGEQSATVSFELKQFTAYNQLRSVFGSNINTSNLFGKSSTSASGNSVTIQKSTGLYVKFIQKYFTLDMDVPESGFILGNISEKVSPVYVSSIAYGRLGVMVIETDYESSNAEKIAKNTIDKLLYKKTTSLTSDEQEFITKSDIKIYLIGGKGGAGVQTITGVESFVKHLTDGGTFSSSSPGVPIFCSFANLSDNSPYKVNFKFEIDSPPVYARVEYENFNNNNYVGKFMQKEQIYGDAYLAFYADQKALVPTIPPKYIKFELSKINKEKYKRRNQMIKDDVKVTDFSKQHLNSGVKMEITSNTLFTYFTWVHSNPRTATHTENTERYLLKEGVFYKIIAPQNIPKSWMNSN